VRRFLTKTRRSLRGSSQQCRLLVLRSPIASPVHLRILSASMLMGTSMPPCTIRARIRAFNRRGIPIEQRHPSPRCASA
jgi:hypothetical protein